MKSTDSHAPAAMRCRAGDIAVIVSAPIPGLDCLIGSHLQCVQLCGFAVRKLREPVWHVTALSRNLASLEFAGQHLHMLDSCLRPLRDRPGDDETLTWAPVPRTQKIAPVGRPKFGVTS